MHRPVLLSALLAAALLSGCVAGGPAPDAPTATALPSPSTGPRTFHEDPCLHPPCEPPAADGDRMAIRGVVLDGSLQPLAATVLLHELNLTQETPAASGTFQFTGLVPHTYFLTASAPEHRPQTLSVDAERARDILRFVLEPLPQEVSFNETVRFHGHLQCALEVLIISPSCDAVLTDPRVGGPALFNSTSTTLLPVGPNWRTVVADVVFDPEAQPLLDGLRVTVQGTFNQSSFGTYEQYGRFNATEPFTFRIEPGQAYSDGTAPVPANMTQFRFEVFPQSKLWHAACVPPEVPEGGVCFLGAGAGLDVDFDLFLTAFYVAPAPDGWTFQAA